MTSSKHGGSWLCLGIDFQLFLKRNKIKFNESSMKETSSKYKLFVVTNACNLPNSNMIWNIGKNGLFIQKYLDSILFLNLNVYVKSIGASVVVSPVKEQIS